MKKSIKAFTVLLLSAILIFGSVVPAFAAEENVALNGITKIEQLNGKNLGVQTGVLYEDYIKDELEGETWYWYILPNDMIPALETKKIDAYLIEEVGYVAQKYEHPELVRLEETVGECPFAVIVGDTNPDKDPGRQDRLYSELQEFIRDGKESGWLTDLYSYWVTNWNPNTCKIREIPTTTGEKGKVTIAIEGGYEPFSFESNGQFSGYDVEFMMNFCAAYGYQWEFVSMAFESIATSVIGGKYDFGMNIAVEDERKDASVLTDPYYSCPLIFVLEGEDPTQIGFFEKLSNSFYKTFIRESRWKLFAEGLLRTLAITVFSVLFGTLLGFALYMACRKGNKIANGIAKVYNLFIEGIPTVVFLMILSFIIFGSSSISTTIISIIGFSLIFGSGMFGNLQVGMGAIPKGQYEAAKALGYSENQSFFKILLPQAAQHFLPIYKANVVSLIKETSVVGYIAVMDLTKMGDLVRSRTYDPFFALIAVAVFYFILEGIMIFIIGRVQNAVNPKRRPDEKILRGIKQVE